MTHYATCIGCIAELDCRHREVLREKLRGLGVTSVKFRCAARVPRFRPGALVWVNTVPDRANLEYDEDDIGYRGGPAYYTFPGVVIGTKGSKALVYIHSGAPSEHNKAIFKGGPVCKIPLSRTRARDGEPETICQSCAMPSSVAHIEGYRCNRPREYW